MVPTLLKPVEIPQVLFLDKVLTCSFVVRRQVIKVLKVLKTVQVPQLQFID